MTSINQQWGSVGTSMDLCEDCVSDVDAFMDIPELGVCDNCGAEGLVYHCDFCEDEDLDYDL